MPRFLLSSRVHYLQRDGRWAWEPVGGSEKPLSAVGCTVCCVSMALAQHGVAQNPWELNRALKAVDGYTSRGLIRWAAIAPATGGRLSAEVMRRPTHREIDAELRAGNPVLIKVAPPPMAQHWVLIVGREGRDYLVKDPLDGARPIKPLSALGSDILAARVVRPAGQ